MKSISGHSIHITHSETGLLLSFSWFEREEGQDIKLNQRMIENADPAILESVRAQLNKLGVEIYFASITDRRFSIICDFPAILAGYYEQIATASDPLAAFVAPIEIIAQPFEGVAHD